MLKQFDNPKVVKSIFISYVVLSVLVFLLGFFTIGLEEDLKILSIPVAILVAIASIISNIIIFMKKTKSIGIFILEILISLAHLWQLVVLVTLFSETTGFFFYGPTALLLSGLCVLCQWLNNKIEGNMKNNEEGLIIFKSKKGKTYIDPKERLIRYRDETIKIDDIKDVELLNKSRVVAKSGIAEAIVAGALFGSIGAVAGAYAGKRDKQVEDYKIVFKTIDIYHATLFIPASYENCIKIADTVFLLRKEEQNELKEAKIN